MRYFALNIATGAVVEVTEAAYIILPHRKEENQKYIKWKLKNENKKIGAAGA